MSGPELALADDVTHSRRWLLSLPKRPTAWSSAISLSSWVNKSVEERIARLTTVVKMLERSYFGSGMVAGPARCVRNQSALVFDEIETAVAASRSEEEKSAGGSKAKRALRHRKALRPISDGSRWLEPKRLLAAKRWKRP
ncbi:hypothetical protein [Mesorhizobium sp.]|uniref:hypothetical protein n=1 Tax=Mesorhizobium sp. TaxID=1871066 RepID=UPI00257A0456|nr:hypothetical protein [Mesorhizobium sp.]